MKIIIAQTKDVKLLARLNKTVQDWHHQQFPEIFKPFDQIQVEKAFLQLLSSPTYMAFIAFNEEASVGYISGAFQERSDSPFQYKRNFFTIDQIAVLPAFRKSGVAKQLLEQLLKIAKEKGASEIQLDHWVGNEAAASFFLKNGFDYFNLRMRRRI